MLTIPGCSQDVSGKWAAPVVIDLAPTRCPEIDAKTRTEFRRTTRRPSGPVTKDGVRQWIDTLELSERRKNFAGERLIDEYERCRGETAATS